MTGTISIDDVSLMSGQGNTGSFNPTTLNINYTPHDLSATGSVTFVFANGSSGTFTTFEMHIHDGMYHIDATNADGAHLRLVWSTQNPTAFNMHTHVSEHGEGGVYNTFVTNMISGSVCFAAGTLIRTPAGDAAVETLKAGDLILTASGDMRAVKWMGHTDVDFRLTPRGGPGLPIRIAADSFGPARPSQDLYLSGGHSVCVDLLGEVLIPIGYLVNGGTIAEVETDEMTYWHVELDGHDILVANNLPAESYLAMANRGSFEELRGLLPAMVEGEERTHADFCRPVVAGGLVLEFVRQRLAARAEDLGWTRMRDPDLRLEVDGRIIHPHAEDGAAAFLFPASAKDVRLVSNTFSPTLFGVGVRDLRSLGVMLVGLTVSGSHGGEPRRISLDDERLRDGVHKVEDHGGELRRWTNGNLVLEPQLWEGLSGQVALLVAYDHTTVRGWVAPASLPKKVDAMERPKLYAIN